MTIDQAIRNAGRFYGISLAETARLASEPSATALPLRRKGEASVGYDGDLVVLDDGGFVQENMVYEDDVIGLQVESVGIPRPHRPAAAPIETKSVRGELAT